jgi:hypothetical protein
MPGKFSLGAKEQRDKGRGQLRGPLLLFQYSLPGQLQDLAPFVSFLNNNWNFNFEATPKRPKVSKLIML